MVRVASAVENGHKSVMIRTTDTVVIVLAVAAVVSLDLNELWGPYGTGKNHEILPAHLFATVCKKNCVKRCKCVKADLPCTPLCMCDGQCIRD